MITISFFTLTDYKARIPSLYPLALAEDCQSVVAAIERDANSVQDTLIIANPDVTVPKTTSNTAIYFVCIELFGKGPEGDIREKGNEKIFSLWNEL